LAYFENADSLKTVGTTALDYAVKIRPADELIITVNSIVPEATAAYNLPLVNPSLEGEVGVSSTPQNQTYIVNTDGEITMPAIGKIHAAGMTTKGLGDYLTEKISKEVDSPVVRVQLANFRVNVLGEVKRPGAIEAKSERFTIFDALAAAEDMTEYGERTNVMVIREENGQRAYHRVNLKDAKIVDSPYYYLQQNDVVYVQPNKIKAGNAKYSQNNAFKVTVVSTVVSAVSVIASLVIALAVK
jgi:polysaccharide export outer membrane protein